MDFEASFFNERQLAAVTHGDGPVIVVSGAGTGKTHLLTGRILYLVLEKKIKPENILALTFTEKAAQEMLERVDKALPLGYNDIWIKTFHGFCDSILREKAFELGLSIDYKLLNEADLWLFLKRHSMDFDLDYYRPAGMPQKFLRAMQNYFSRLQDEDISPESYLNYAKKIMKSAETDEEKEIAKKNNELANAYDTYVKLLAKENCMDFGGLIFNTLRLLEKRKSVLKELQERFQYILVDEFQDTNFSQNKIVTALARKHENLMVVGDDDQSIYKWRGASLTNIKYFEKIFPNAKKIVLNRNYRSTQKILDLAYSVIQKNNPNRMEYSEKVDKKLLAESEIQGSCALVRHFSSLDEELDFVIKSAEDAQSKGLNSAILVRTNAQAEPFLERLQKTGLEYQHFSQAGLFTKAGVKDCIAALRAISDPGDTMALYRCLSMSFWGISMKNLLASLKKSKSGNISLLEAGGDSEEFATAKKIFAELTEFARLKNVSEVLVKFLNESGYIQYYSKIESGNPDDENKMKDIAAFSSTIANFEQTHPSKDINEFLDYYRILEEVGDAKSEQEINETSIKIMTVHASKGLEFDAVFIPGLVNGRFPSVSRRDSFTVPAELIEESLPETDRHVEEERRLFYVAVTRAKKILSLTYSDYYDGKKLWKISPFLAESVESGKAVLKETKTKKSANQASFQFQRDHKPIDVDPLKLSYSKIGAFLDCPLKYRFKYLYEIESPVPSIFNFGSSIHNTLKDFYEYLKRNPDKLKKNLLPELEKIYFRNWIPYGYESKAIHDFQKTKGLELLKNYYEKEKVSLLIPAYIEKEFKLKIGKIAPTIELNGRIDRIDRLDDGTYEVIDYKTGANKEKSLKNDIQLSIYALACKEILKIPVTKLSLYFIESLEKCSTSRSDEDLEKCKEEIIKTGSEIASSDYSPKPGFNCSFCDYRLICSKAARVVG